MSEYRVALEAYNGPLDLLLFLIKREEVDIHDIPIARITQEYVNYVELLKALDPEAVGDFLVLAATLMEIKSRMLLPKPPPEEIEEDLDDPRMELVRQLLEYKKFKDAASMLEDQADDQARRFPRKPTLPPRDPDDIELDNLELWDLFDAFNRMLEQTGKRQYTHKVEIDDTPIALHADDIVDALEHAGGETTFESLFTGRSRGEMIGLFLALLELAKRRRI
ncbi:MAG: segregation and condensation protein A, partial [Phycisphaerae bacterium]